MFICVYIIAAICKCVALEIVDVEATQTTSQMLLWLQPYSKMAVAAEILNVCVCTSEMLLWLQPQQHMSMTAATATFVNLLLLTQFM